MIKGVFFDLDGTIINSMFSHYIGWKKILLKHNVNIEKRDFFIKEGTKLQDLLNYFFLKNKITPNKILISEAIKDKNNFFIKNYNLRFYPGIKNLINFLVKEKLYVSIVTAGSKKRIYKSLPKSFIKQFNLIISGDDCKRGKPYPDPYLMALKKSKLKASECIVYENAPLGVLSAKRAKIKTVAVTNTLNRSELKNADYIVNSAIDFKKIIVNANA